MPVDGIGAEQDRVGGNATLEDVVPVEAVFAQHVARFADAHGLRQGKEPDVPRARHVVAQEGEDFADLAAAFGFGGGARR